jgi:lipid II:glycine glycyltransferase (peptidoglycan interpeptide bridge formation enzyme)
VPASHQLVWETIRWAKEHGCSALDFVGYGMTAQPGDPMSGINQFKRGFAPLDNLVRMVAMHEKVLAPTVVATAGAARKAEGALRRGYREH